MKVFWIAICDMRYEGTKILIYERLETSQKYVALLIAQYLLFGYLYIYWNARPPPALVGRTVNTLFKNLVEFPHSSKRILAVDFNHYRTSITIFEKHPQKRNALSLIALVKFVTACLRLGPPPSKEAKFNSFAVNLGGVFLGFEGGGGGLRRIIAVLYEGSTWDAVGLDGKVRGGCRRVDWKVAAQVERSQYCACLSFSLPPSLKSLVFTTTYSLSISHISHSTIKAIHSLQLTLVSSPVSRPHLPVFATLPFSSSYQNTHTLSLHVQNRPLTLPMSLQTGFPILPRQEANRHNRR